ncbi:MAG: hypothetical protein ABJB11_18730 [Ferruginibacter sp.]
MLVWLFLSFVILIFLLAIGTAIVAGLITILLYKRMDYFLPIFKSGFLPGSIGIVLLLIIGIFFETEIDQATNFGLLWLTPVAFTGIGLTVGAIRIYRTKQH